MDHMSNFDSSSSYVLEAHEAMRTYKFMTSERLGASYNFEERETSSCVCQFKYKTLRLKMVVFSSHYKLMTSERLGASYNPEERETTSSVLKFYEDFNYKTNPCLVFEELAIDLLMFTEFVVGSGLHLYDIRLIAQQVLVGLDFLHSNGIVHKDIKPNNIMLVDWSSLKVKLIDMGFTEEIGSMSNFYPNPLIFIPPEGIMRDKPDASLDMWCLGITLIYFYLKYFLFDYGTRDKTLAAIVKMLGEPHCSKTFSSWKNVIKKYDPVLKLQSLDDLLEIRPATQDPAEREDLLSFIDFLKQMIVPTPQERITSAAALKHNFITMDHLAVPSERLCKLAQPRPPAPGWQPGRPLPTPVSSSM
uniref:Protein kinase domain-containing protein n=1 Tax=Cyprinodon variegatus TaxID=28743 RepID=A0A3Q2CKD0_CYPVA